MKLFTSILLILAAVCLLQKASAATDKIVCYYGSWAVYRQGNGKFDVEDLDPFICTHAIYTFTGIRETGEVYSLDSWNDLEDNYGKGALKRFNKLKEKNPNLKTLIAIGGWNEGSQKYSTVMSNPSTRANFIKSAVDFVQKYGFDGFDLDWEYPCQRGGKPEDKENYSQLLREMRPIFDKNGLLLTAAVAAAAASVDQSYDVKALSENLDWINVMAYDLHGTWDKKTGHNAPLYPGFEGDVLDVQTCIEGWIERGADPAKLVLGMGTYGRSFTLDSVAQNGIGAPSNNPGNAGPYTRQAGMMGYNEIIELLKQGGWTEVWDDKQQIPYMYKGNQWIGYDNPKSVELKMEWAKSKGLGGGMIWSIETEDFHGLSGQKNPILTKMNEVLGKPVIPTEPTKPTDPTDPTESTSTEPTVPTEPTEPTEAPEPTDVCKEPNTWAPDLKDCAKFWWCAVADGKFEPVEYHCGSGTVFNPRTHVCDFPANVPECNE